MSKSKAPRPNCGPPIRRRKGNHVEAVLVSSLQPSHESLGSTLPSMVGFLQWWHTLASQRSGERANGCLSLPPPPNKKMVFLLVSLQPSVPTPTISLLVSLKPTKQRGVPTPTKAGHHTQISPVHFTKPLKRLAKPPWHLLATGEPWPTCKRRPARRSAE